MPSSFNEVIRQLQRQRAAIDRALAALQEVDQQIGDEPELSRLPATKAAKKKGPQKTAAKRTLSPEARKRISDAVKKRWAATKKGAKKQPAKKAA